MATCIVLTRGEIHSFQIQSPNFYATLTPTHYAQFNAVELCATRITQLIAPLAQCRKELNFQTVTMSNVAEN